MRMSFLKQLSGLLSGPRARRADSCWRRPGRPGTSRTQPNQESKRKRNRERDTERERKKERTKQRKTDKQIERKAGREREGETNQQNCIRVLMKGFMQVAEVSNDFTRVFQDFQKSAPVMWADLPGPSTRLPRVGASGLPATLRPLPKAEYYKTYYTMQYYIIL